MATTTTSSRRHGRHAMARAGFMLAGASASAVAFAPNANATPIDDAANQIGALIDDALTGAAAPAAPAAPDMPNMLDTFAAQVAGVAPSNLLRTRGGEADATEAPSTQNIMTYAAGPNDPAGQVAPATFAPTGIDYSNSDRFMDAARDMVPAIQTFPETLLAAHDGTQDPNTIGQVFGGVQMPLSDTITAIQSDVNELVGRVTSGAVIGDIQSAIADTLASPAVEQWRANEASIFGINEALPGVERATVGLSAAIDEFTRDPLRFGADLLTAAGGPARMLLDPIGGAVAAITQIVGPEMVASFNQFISDAANQIVPSLLQAAPALLIAPAMTLGGALLGAPLGALPGSGIGAILGALNPLNLLGGLAGAIPGAILGGLATGAIGLVGSILATLPLFGIFPLAGAATASALGLVVLASTVFGLYALSFIPAAIGSLLIGGFLGVATTAVLLLLSGFNPVYIPESLASGFLVFLLSTVVAIGLYAALTIAIPMIIFGVLAPLFIIGGAVLGGLLGLAAAALAASVIIPLATVLSAIPGAIAGGLLGGLIGTGIASLLGALTGAVLGGLVGALIGSLIGGTIGTLVGVPVALAVFAALAAMNFGSWLERAIADPNNFPAQIRRAMDQAWRDSAFGRIFGTFENNMWGTDSGRALSDLLNRINGLAQVTAFLDGRRLREMLLRGGLLGAILGAIPGGITGATVGGVLGALNPLNLLNGLMGFIAGAIPGALGGAAAGSLLSDLLGLAVGIPAGVLSFLPWLGVLATLWAIPAVLTTLAALASTIIPAIASAISTTLIAGILFSSPLWLPFAIVSSILTLIQALAFNPLTAGVLLPLNAFIIPVVFVSVAAEIIILLSAIALAAIFVGIPTFLIVAALFTFPALAVPLLWLASLPLLLPLAAGLSTLTGLTVGSITDLLSKLLTVPAGALVGGLLTGIPAGLIATAVASVTRSIVYGTAGTGIGAGLGAAAGFIPGMIAALITHLRLGAGINLDGVNPTLWADGRIVNKRGFGDILAGLPGLSGEKYSFAPAPYEAVPAVAGTGFDPVAAPAAGRELVDVTGAVNRQMATV